MKKYGLRSKKTGDIIRYYKEENEDKQFCNKESFYLTDDWRGQEEWYADTLEDALYVKWTSEEWYSSTYETPVNPLRPEDLEVFKVVTITGSQEMSREDEIKIVNERLRKEGYSEIN